MYFFYFDESGSRDPSVGTAGQPKDHLYVLTAIGLYEQKWHHFERAITHLKLELADRLMRDGKGRHDLAGCEVKSNWLRNAGEREKRSPFLHNLDEADRNLLKDRFYAQIASNNMPVISVVVDKRHLLGHVTHELLHKKAYELVLERIENYMAEYHAKHQALIVMDDTSKQLNQAIALKHAYFQRAGNQRVTFRHIVEYPFFTRSELSNGVQLADLVSYNVYRAFRNEDISYPYFEALCPHIYSRPTASAFDGLKVWPPESPLVNLARQAWTLHKKALAQGEGN